MRVILGLLFSCLFCTTAAFADKTVPVFVSGNWQGTAYIGTDGRGSHCAMRTGYQSGIYVTFGIFPNGIGPLHSTDLVASPLRSSSASTCILMADLFSARRHSVMARC
jgi:hypothetical protein